MKKVVAFGEIMIRIAPEGFLRFIQAFPGDANITFAGAEANVAVSLALLGRDSSFITTLPQNDIADACISTLRRYGVNVDGIKRSKEGRLGIYFVETGSNQRPSNVVYDRAYSSVSMADPASYDWASAFAGKDWFHVTGITPSLSQEAAAATLAAVQAAKRADRKSVV